LEGLSPAELEKKMQGMSPEEMMKMGGAPPSAQGAAAAQSEIPERYSKPEESGLTSTVGPGGADPANFDLTE
jgi:hypothetical protein